MAATTPALVINLDQDRQRWAEVSDRLKQVGLTQVHRMRAVYGKALSAQQKRRHTTPWCNDVCTDSTIGCFLSHVNCWREIVKNNWPYAYVFEDDAVPTADFVRQVDSILPELPPDCHILLLGCYLCRPGKDSDLGLRVSASISKVSWASKRLRRAGHWYGSHGMLLTREGALECLRRHPVASYHVDMVLCTDRHLNTYVTVLGLVAQQRQVDGSHSTGERPLIIQQLDRVKIDDGRDILGFTIAMPVIRIGPWIVRVWHATVLAMLLLWLVVWWVQSCKPEQPLH